MGAANLVPGISGGTMVVICRLYPTFVDATADLTRFRANRRALLFLLLLFGVNSLVMAALAEPVALLVRDHRTLAYSLFIGMTLAGTPILWQLWRRAERRSFPPWLSWLAAVLAFALTASLVFLEREEQVQEAPAIVDEAVETEEEYRPESDIFMDATAGAAAYSAMVLPGISGGTLKLAMDRYEPTVWSIGQVGNWVLPWRDSAPFTAFGPILIAYVLGAIAGLALVSNALRWLLHHYERPATAALIGILLGSIVPLWPIEAFGSRSSALSVAGLIVLGFVVVWLFSRWSNSRQ